MVSFNWCYLYKTHDISLLLNNLEKQGFDMKHYNDLIEYNVYAVQHRYEAYNSISESINREQTIRRVSEIVIKVEKMLQDSEKS